MVTIHFDPNTATPDLYRGAIAELGYDAIAPSGQRAPTVVSRQLTRLYVPTDAPKFFVNAIERAKSTQRPIIVEFWAKWCVACIKLKRETLEDPDVAEALSAVEVIYVDLDKYPALGEAYGVDAIPDLFFIDKSGRIVDRLQRLEPPENFVARVRKAFGQPLIRDTVDR